MAAKPAARERAPREKSRVRRIAEGYLGAFTVAVLLALAARSLFVFAAGFFTVGTVAVVHAWVALRTRLKGGKRALRHRATYQGHAPLAEIRRNLTPHEGVPIGTVRSTR